MYVQGHNGVTHNWLQKVIQQYESSVREFEKAINLTLEQYKSKYGVDQVYETHQNYYSEFVKLHNKQNQLRNSGVLLERRVLSVKILSDLVVACNSPRNGSIETRYLDPTCDQINSFPLSQGLGMIQYKSDYYLHILFGTRMYFGKCTKWLSCKKKDPSIGNII